MKNTVWMLLISGSLALVGCGGAVESGPPRFRLSGKVTFDGKPVPAGTIYFEPATGPAGSAQIKDGQYDTANGKGITGGATTVMIEGYDGQAAEGQGMGKPIFKPFKSKEDLPSAEGTKDFEVPASAAKGLIISNDPA
jgi:hypothetical protein